MSHAERAATPLPDTTPPDGDTFGNRLRTLLAERGLSGSAVSRLLGCSQQAVSKWLRGGNIADHHLRALAELLAVDWLWLRHGDEVLKARARGDGLGPEGGLRTETFQRLVLAEERLSMAIEAAVLGTWEWDLASDQMVLSARMAGLVGLGGRELALPLAGFLERVQRDDAGWFRQALEQAARSGEAFQVDVRVYGDGDTVRWLFLAGKFLADWRTHATRGLGIAKDISGRKRVEENLRRERDVYHRLFEGSTSLLAALDGHGRIQRCNRAFERWLGYEPSELVGRELCELLASIGRDKPDYDAFAFTTGRHPARLVTDSFGKDGRVQRIHWFIERLDGDAGYFATGHVERPAQGTARPGDTALAPDAACASIRGAATSG